jgi:hypothetical protein
MPSNTILSIAFQLIYLFPQYSTEFAEDGPQFRQVLTQNNRGLSPISVNGPRRECGRELGFRPTANHCASAQLGAWENWQLRQYYSVFAL